MEIVAEIIFEL